MLRAASEVLLDEATVEETQSTSSLIANLKEFAPSIDLVSGQYAGSVIGAELTIQGVVESSGLVEIYGTVEGDIRGAAVTIAESGVVKGSIEAKMLMVNGKVTGDLHASEVELGPTADVEGNIHHRTLIMAKGARFEGRTSRMSPAAGSIPTLLAENGAARSQRTGESMPRSNLVPLGDVRRPAAVVPQEKTDWRAAS